MYQYMYCHLLLRDAGLSCINYTKEKPTFDRERAFLVLNLDALEF